MTRWALLLICFLQAVPPKASIEGTVVRIGTSDPVADVRVALVRIGVPVDRTHPQQVSEMTTSSDGRFIFKDVDAGSYRLRFVSNGYVRQEFGQRTFTGDGTPLVIAAGKAMKDVVIGLTPTGSVSGRIRDANGEPLAGIPVTLLQYSYDDTGRRTLQRVNVSQNDQTDDRGAYRLFFVTPGKYFLYAGMPSPIPFVERDEVLESYSHVFYPGVVDVRQASSVVVQSGVDSREMNLTLSPQPVYRIRGRIADSISGKAPATASVSLTYGDASWSFGYGMEYIGGEKGSYDNGVFEFRNVIPGVFHVRVVAEDTDMSRIAYTTVQVTNTDIEDAVVMLPGKPATLSGRLTFEGKPYPPDRRLVQILRTDGDSRLLPEPDRPAIDANGRFRFEVVPPGDYRVSAVGYDGFYFKEARFGGMDALNGSFHFTGSENSSLEIVMSPNVAAVEGSAVNDKRDPVANSAVVLVPDRYRDRTDLFKTATTDAKGHFSIGNVVPGEYRLFAWETLEPYQYFDPDFLARSESKSVPVRLSESSKQSVDVRVIAAAQ